jgi:ketosteroid isomerase-like protein
MAQTETFLRETYDQFIKGGIGAIIDRFDDDCVWHITGRSSPLARDWQGKYGVNDFFRQLMDMSGGTFELSLHDVHERGNLGIAFVHERARRDKKNHDMDTVHVWQVRGGVVTEFWRWSPDTQADDDFWA